MEGFELLRVTTSDNGRTWLLELDHGKANEIGSAVLRELEALAERLETDPTVTALVTFSRRRSSKGTPIFVAGADVTERVGWDDDRILEHVRWQRQVLSRLRRAPVFHCVVVGGIALGWGTEFLLTADHRIAAHEAVFGLPETGLGILPGAGGTAELWAEIGLGHALRLGMTGERIDADEALRIGLVHERCASLDDGLERAAQLATLVARRSPTAVAAFKRAALDAVGRPPAERAALEDAAYTLCVRSGEAAIGRNGFQTIGSGGTPTWGPRRTR